MRWLVTGAAGFLGIALIKKLIKLGIRVRGLDINAIEDKNLLKKIEFKQGDICDRKKVFEACKGIDIVVHAAAALPIVASKAKIEKVNFYGTKVLLESCLKNKVKKIIFISTTAIYGIPKSHPIYEDSPKSPIGYYGISKFKAEKLCEKFREKGLNIAILRPKTFLGAGRLGVFEILFDWLRRGKKIYVLGDGENRYQLLSVSDLIDAILICAKSRKANDTFNLGAKKFGKLKEDLQALIDYAGTGSKLVFLPAKPIQILLRVLEILRLSPLVQWQYETMDKESYVSISKAEKILNWHPKQSNKEVLIESYKWYLKNYKKFEGKKGLTHTSPWDQKILKLIRFFS